MKYKQVRGFTVTEMVAALAVLSLVALGGGRAAQNHYRDADYRLLERNAFLVMSALNSYYEANCSTSGFNGTPSVSQLVSQGFLENSSYAKNPFGDDLWGVVNRSNPASLAVYARVTTMSQANLGATVGATPAGRGLISWVSAPAVLTADDNLYNMQLKHMYEPGVCQ